MSHFDELLGKVKAPDEDAIVAGISLPGGAVRAPGQHGGTGGGSSSDTVGAVSTSGPPPTPQRDDPDEGEHMRSSEEAVVVPVVDEVDDDTGSVEEIPAPEPIEELVPDEIEQDLVEPDVLSVRVTEVVSTVDIEGSAPITFEKVAFSAGERPSTVVKPFPQPVVDKLRNLLALTAGGKFAMSLSTPAVLTAFVCAETGLELELDINTAAAVDAFRKGQSRLLAVEEKVSEAIEDIETMAMGLKHSLRRIATIGEVVDRMDFAMTWMLADRVLVLPTQGVTERTFDPMADNRVLTLRQTLQTKAKQQLLIEQRAAGRAAL